MTEAKGKSISLYKKQREELQKMEEECKNRRIKGVNRSELVRIATDELYKLSGEELERKVREYRVAEING